MAARKTATPKKSPVKTTSPRQTARKTTGKRARVKKVIEQAKEPLSLLQTLREEGMANAMVFFNLASHLTSSAAKNLRPESLMPQLKEAVGALGFALREDLERLEERLGELEQKLSEREYAALGGKDSEE